jgi:hypothetical protein
MGAAGSIAVSGQRRARTVGEEHGVGEHEQCQVGCRAGRVEDLSEGGLSMREARAPWAWPTTQCRGAGVGTCERPP